MQRAIHPLVSIIIPTYNRGWPLQRAIESVINQTYQYWELLIQDDGSDPYWSTWVKNELLSNYAKWPIYYDFQLNSGVSSARNLGIRRSRGKWLAFLDSDDQWLPHKLTTQLAWAQAHPDHPLIHGEELWIRNGYPVNKKKKHKKGGGRQFIESINQCCIGPSTVLIKRSLFDGYMFFNPSFPVCEDYELWLRITSENEIGFISEPLIYKYGGHDDQLSMKYVAMDHWRIKALWPFLKSQKISPPEILHLRKVLLQKYDLLKKGYIKHKRHKELDHLIKLFQSAFDI